MTHWIVFSAPSTLLFATPDSHLLSSLKVTMSITTSALITRKNLQRNVPFVISTTRLDTRWWSTWSGTWTWTKLKWRIQKTSNTCSAISVRKNGRSIKNSISGSTSWRFTWKENPHPWDRCSSDVPEKTQQEKWFATFAAFMWRRRVWSSTSSIVMKKSLTTFALKLDATHVFSIRRVCRNTRSFTKESRGWNVNIAGKSEKNFGLILIKITNDFF